MEALSRLATEIEKRHPCTNKFNPEELARTLRQRGGVVTIIHKGRSYGWIGNRGSLWNAPLGMMTAYVRCTDVHGEDAAKIWSWNQGWIVGVDTVYYDDFKEEIDAADKPVHPGSVETSMDADTEDRPAESSGDDLDDLDSPLPF